MPTPWHRAPPAHATEVETDDDTFLTVERWPREVFAAHFHSEFNWIVPMRPGRVVVEVEGREHTVEGNGWICVFPWTAHRIVHVSDDCEVLSLFVPEPAMARAFEALPDEDRPELGERCIVGGAGTVAQGLALAWGELRFSRRTPDAVDAALEAFVTGWLWRAYRTRIDDEGGLLLRVKLGGIGDAAATFFEAHLADTPFPWDALAAEVGLSRRTLQRQFVEALGRSPSDVLTTLRLERARSLLADPSRSVGDIALACGFNSQSHFTTVFRVAFGVAPGRYRAGR